MFANKGVPEVPQVKAKPEPATKGMYMLLFFCVNSQFIFLLLANAKLKLDHILDVMHIACLLCRKHKTLYIKKPHNKHSSYVPNT